jgi:hypothetical protein
VSDYDFEENECANLGELMDNLDLMSDFESVYPTVDDYFNFKKQTDARNVTHVNSRRVQ